MLCVSASVNCKRAIADVGEADTDWWKPMTFRDDTGMHRDSFVSLEPRSPELAARLRRGDPPLPPGYGIMAPAVAFAPHGL